MNAVTRDNSVPLVHVPAVPVKEKKRITPVLLSSYSTVPIPASNGDVESARISASVEDVLPAIVQQSTNMKSFFKAQNVKNSSPNVTVVEYDGADEDSLLGVLIIPSDTK